MYHAISTAANNDRGKDAPNQPPSHPIRAPIITNRNLRIRDNEQKRPWTFCTRTIMRCCAESVELADQPTNHPIVSLRDL